MQTIDEINQGLMSKLAQRRAEIADRHPTGVIPDDRPPPCPTCKGAGLVAVKPVDPVNGVTEQETAACPDCHDGKALKERSQRRVLAETGLEDWPDVTFEKLPPLDGQEESWDAGLTYAGHPDGWLLLVGQSYVGKTRLALCIANDWLSNDNLVLFRSVPDALMQLRNTPFGEGYTELLRAMITVPCLVLDDYGKEDDSGRNQELLFQISDARMEKGLPTVVTTNLDLTEFQRRYPRLYRRLADSTKCSIVQFDNQPIER